MGYKVIFCKENELEELVMSDCDIDVELVIWVLVVIIMGYVDYGKILLFDYICKVKVVVGEVGGII